MFFGKSKSTYDCLIVGLGNIGIKYDGTRHNMGFATVDELEKKLTFKPWKEKFKAYITECEIAGKRCLVAKPLTFMNLSGEAVRAIVAFYKIPISSIIVISDDIDLDPGRIRVKRNGSDGGQRGLRSIIEYCGSSDFPRIKIGVGKKPHPDYDLADWVLSRYSGEEGEKIKAGIENAAKAVIEIVKNGADSAMNIYNRQVK